MKKIQRISTPILKTSDEPGIGMVVKNTKCRICAFPQEIKDLMERQRADRTSYEEIANDFNDELKDRLKEGILDKYTETVTRYQVQNHLENHVATTGQIVRMTQSEMRVEMLMDMMEKRSEIYTSMYSSFMLLSQSFTERYEEFRKFQELENKARKTFFEVEVPHYLEMLQTHREAREATLEAEAASGSTEVASSIIGAITAMSQGLQINALAPPTASAPIISQSMPSMPQLAKIRALMDEEKRLFSWAEVLRKQAAEAAKIVSFDESYDAIIFMELEELFRELSAYTRDETQKTIQSLTKALPVEKSSLISENMTSLGRNIISHMGNSIKQVRRELRKTRKEAGGK